MSGDDDLGRRFLAHLAADPGAVFAESGDRIATRADVAAEAEGLAARMGALGIGSGDPVGLACLDSLRAMEASIALWSLGAAPAYFDIRQPTGEIVAAAGRAGARVVLTDMPRLAGKAGFEPLGAPGATGAGGAPTFPENAADLTAIWLSSSGTTKLPVHRAVSHRNMMANMLDAEIKLRSHPLPPALAVGSLAFGAVANNWMRAVMGGTPMVAMPLFYRIEDLDAALKRPDILFASLPPVVLRDLMALHRGRDVAAEGRAYPQLKGLVAVGGPLPHADLVRMRDLLSATARNVYSMSGVGAVSYLEGAEIDTHPETVGRVLDGVEVTVTDDDGKVLPPGETGNIIARNSSQDAPAIATGDIGRLDADGFLTILGRSAQIACRRSVTIHLGALQDRILTNEAMRDCLAFAVPDPTDGGDRIALAVETALSPREVALWLRSAIPASMRPDLLWVSPDLPRTPSGKIALRDLQARVVPATSEEERVFVPL